MKAAIYVRVSTEDQEKEGTSLQSQKEACLNLAREGGYEVSPVHIIEEVYSGLILDRPKLTQLRQWVESNEIDAVVVYTLDRLSRDPVHTVILEEHFEGKGIKLICVTETIDSSDLGKLVTYIKGYAAKLEAEKIRERTMRGIKERVKAGKMPSGRRARLFGYTYLPGRGVGEGIRYINEAEVVWVREMFRWLIDEGLTLNGITYRLRALNVPTPSGKGFWIRSTVYRILTNPAYIGKTYCFTHIHKEGDRHYKENRKYRKTSIEIKPYEEGIEIKGATPPIIEPELFEAAQARLRQNKERASRNGKVNYLLRGHIYCSRCGRKYWGYCRWHDGQPDKSNQRYYYCMGRRSIITIHKCNNKGYQADYLEEAIWQEVEAILSKPELVLTELQRQQQNSEKLNFFRKDKERVENQLANLEKQKQRLWKAFEITGDEETFRKDIALLGKEIKALEAGKLELERRIEVNKQFSLDANGVNRACELVKRNLGNLSFSEKRLALEALQIKVWIDGDNIAIEGAIPVLSSDIVSTPLCLRKLNKLTLNWRERMASKDISDLIGRKSLSITLNMEILSSKKGKGSVKITPSF